MRTSALGLCALVLLLAVCASAQPFVPPVVRSEFVILAVVTCSASLLLQITQRAPGMCIWKSQCGPGVNSGIFDCYNNTQAEIVTDPEMMTMLQDTCPSLVQGPDNTTTCCDKKIVCTNYHVRLLTCISHSLVSVL
jgi:hypothetical protein